MKPFLSSQPQPSATRMLQRLALCAALASVPAAAQTAPVPTPVKPDPLKAERAYLSGARLLERKNFVAAEAEFVRAATLDPTRHEYNLAVDLTREQRITDLIQQAAHARILRHNQQADSLIAEARAIDPHSEIVEQHTSEPTEAAKLVDSQIAPRSSFTPKEVAFAGPIQIMPNPGPQNLHLRGEMQQVITQAATAYGIKAVFEDGVTGQPMRFDLDDAPYTQAMPILLSMGHLFAVPVDAKTLLFTKDTQENRQRLERLIEETIYIPGSTTEQLNELSNIVKNVFDVKQVVASPTSGTLLVRAPETTIKAMNYTLADLVDGGAEVMLRLQLISVDKLHSVNTGASTPSSIGAFSVAAEAQNIVSQNQAAVQALISSGGYTPTGNYIKDTLTEAILLVFSGVVQDAKLTGFLGTVGGGLTLLGVNYAGSAALNLNMNASESRALDDISVRVGDRQTTTLRVGSKYPVTTSTYSSGVSSSTASLLAGKTINGVSATSLLSQYLSGASAQTVPMVQYEDLGITLKATPLVLKSGLVTVHIDLKLEALTGASANNIPVLTSRAFTSDITVADGGTAIMLSDLSSTEAASVSGIPGLADLPGLRQSVADNLRETNSSELVLLVTPQIVRRRSNSMASRRISFSTSVPQEN
jgi:general secretion pathway protein D